jgi:hypothetical protein
MPFFILDYERNLKGNRTIHKDTDECESMPLIANRLALGFHENLEEVENVVKHMDDRYEFCKSCCLEGEQKSSSSLVSYF